MSNVVKIEDTPTPAVNETAAIIQMIERAATNPQVDVEKFARLLELREKVEANFARKSFNAAVANAKGDIGPIFKDKSVDFTTQKGRTNYRYEGFDTVSRAVDPILNQHGLSYRFRAAQANNKLSVTCILFHKDGYSEETTLETPEDHSGNKNTIQAIGSAATYLQRYTLKLALGLSTSKDDDGLATSGGADSATADFLTDDQVGELQTMIVRAGADLPRFLRYFKIEKLDDLPAAKFASAVSMLKAKEARS